MSAAHPVIRNARITATSLGFEDHGILSFGICLDYGGAGQWAGGYALDGADPNDPRSGVRHYVSCRFLGEILRVLGVEKWEKLPGTSCRVESEHHRVNRIGHLLNDEWVNFAELFLAEAGR